MSQLQKLALSIALVILTFSSPPSIAEPSDCTNYSVVHFNGLNTSYSEALDEVRALRMLGEQTGPNGGKVEYHLAYNTSKKDERFGLLSDFWEALKQQLDAAGYEESQIRGDYGDLFWNAYGDTFEALTGEEQNDFLEQLNEEILSPEEYETPLISDQSRQYTLVKKLLDQGESVLLVGYSQGGLFAEQMYTKIKNERIYAENQIRIMHVGSAILKRHASGPHILSTNDTVINRIARIPPGELLETNITIPKVGNGHSLISTYLEPNIGLPQFRRVQKSEIEKLEPPKELVDACGDVNYSYIVRVSEGTGCYYYHRPIQHLDTTGFVSFRRRFYSEILEGSYIDVAIEVKNGAFKAIVDTNQTFTTSPCKGLSANVIVQPRVYGRHLRNDADLLILPARPKYEVKISGSVDIETTHSGGGLPGNALFTEGTSNQLIHRTRRARYFCEEGVGCKTEDSPSTENRLGPTSGLSANTSDDVRIRTVDEKHSYTGTAVVGPVAYLPQVGSGRSERYPNSNQLLDRVGPKNYLNPNITIDEDNPFFFQPLWFHDENNIRSTNNGWIQAGRVGLSAWNNWAPGVFVGTAEFEIEISESR